MKPTLSIDQGRTGNHSGGVFMLREGVRRPVRERGISLVLPSLAVVLLIPSLAVAGPPPGAEFIGSGMCADCHEEVVQEFAGSVHSILLDSSPEYDDRLCEMCHGPGSAHAEEEDPALIVNPAKVSDSEAESLCLDCHSGRKFSDWQFSSHQTEGVSCVSCHSGHAGPGEMLRTETPELCLGCHTDVRAAFYLPSHHPVSEGRMDCMSCHGVHGSQDQFVMGIDQRDRCFACHADKEGPFIFEHAPVNEDCSLCHTPHGSVSDNLLVQGEPALCLSCHPMHFHATIPGIESDEFTAPQAPDRTLSSTRDGFKVTMLTKCTRCHTAIHGTDDPAQGISGSGQGLTR